MTQQLKITKTCIGCLSELPHSNFYMAKKTGVYSSRCKKCDIIENQRRSSSSYKRRSAILCNAAKSNGKKRNLSFEINQYDVIQQYEKQNGRCYYSGVSMTWKTGDSTLMSIDRIDSSKGYLKDNFVLCCWDVNQMKREHSEKSFLTLCQTIATFSKIRRFDNP